MLYGLRPSWRTARQMFMQSKGKARARFCNGAGRANEPYTASEIALMQNVENTYLSWTRNGLIATSAGLFIMHYNASVGELKRMPLSGLSVLCIGGLFIVAGSFSFIR